jgi:uncharacterized protein
MNLGFGSDFWAGVKGELYDARTGQPLWLTVALVFALFVILSILQTIAGFMVLPFMDGPAVSLEDPAGMQAGLAKAMIVGLLPSSMATAFIAWKLAGVQNAPGNKGIPLHLLSMGAAGWATVVGGLIVFLWAAFALTFVVMGIDPETYAPTKDGINDLNSAAGMVEKVMADLSDEPILFALALPGVTIAVPIVEELIFRGALFSALRYSWFGKTGAVILTAAAWAIVHGMAAPWLFVFIIFIMGLALGWLLLRFGSVTLTIVCHACWNLFSSLAIFGGQ